MTEGEKRVLAVQGYGGFELLPASKDNLRKLEILFGLQPYRARPEDLADPDLAPRAREALAASGKLRAEDLARGDPAFLQQHFAALELEAQRRFLTELVEPLRRNAALRPPVLYAAARARRPALVKEIAALVALIGDEPQHLYTSFWSEVDVWVALAESKEIPPPDLSPLAAPFAERVRSPWANSDFSRFRPHFDAPAKAVLAAHYLKRVDARRANSEDQDHLRVIVSLVQEAPELSLLEPLAPLAQTRDPWTADWLMEMLTALVRAHPSCRARAQAIAAPILNGGPWIKSETRYAWDAALA
jgi:hypothetical protein